MQKGQSVIIDAKEQFIQRQLLEDGFYYEQVIDPMKYILEKLIDTAELSVSFAKSKSNEVSIARLIMVETVLSELLISVSDHITRVGVVSK